MEEAGLPELFTRARSGDQVAARELVGLYEDDVLKAVRARLPRVLRSQFDSLDFVQAVWTSVLSTKDEAELPRFENPQHVIAYLSGMARNKVYAEHRKRSRTAKYDIKREEPLYVRRGDREVPRDVPGRGPTPSEEGQAGDRLAQILDGRDAQSALVIELRREGLTYDEIAERLEIAASSARKIINRARERLGTRGFRQARGR